MQKCSEATNQIIQTNAHIGCSRSIWIHFNTANSCCSASSATRQRQRQRHVSRNICNRPVHLFYGHCEWVSEFAYLQPLFQLYCTNIKVNMEQVLCSRWKIANIVTQKEQFVKIKNIYIYIHIYLREFMEFEYLFRVKPNVFRENTQSSQNCCKLFFIPT